MQVTFQDYESQVIRAAAILTNSYVPATVLGVADLVESKNQLVLLISFTIGSLTDGRVRVEFSPDGTTYYRETSTSAPTAGLVDDVAFDHRYVASGNYRIAIPLKDRYVRVSALGTGTLTASSMTITAVVGTA